MLALSLIACDQACLQAMILKEGRTFMVTEACQHFQINSLIVAKRDKIQMKLRGWLVNTQHGSKVAGAQS